MRDTRVLALSEPRRDLGVKSTCKHTRAARSHAPREIEREIEKERGVVDPVGRDEFGKAGSDTSFDERVGVFRFSRLISRERRTR